MKINFEKYFFTYFLATLFISSSTVNASNKQHNLVELIDIVGQQRMLVHRVLVSYAQIGQVQSFGNPVNTKINAIKQFEKNIDILKNSVQAQQPLLKMVNTWNKLKVITLAIPDRRKMKILIGYNEDIVAYANEIMSLLLNKDGRNAVNIAGKQRMLSQRIALFMLMENWGFKDSYTTKMQISLANFSLNIKHLKKNKDNNEQINKLLNSLDKDYINLIKIISRGKKERDYSFSISRYTSQMLRKSKKMTQLYVRLPAV